MNLIISTFYRFLPLSSEVLVGLSRGLELKAKAESVRGLILLSEEGINGTVSARAAGLEKFKNFLLRQLAQSELNFKEAPADKHPFRVFQIKIKPEIVSLGKPELRPTGPRNHHLTPREWHEALKNPQAVVIDTRNTYETAIGKFKTAIALPLTEFNQFPERLASAKVGKDQPVLLYCTGGIRCEKAILEMQQQGYRNVHQLEGGILNYLREFPNAEFEGECFVFDYRVALDQDLQPTRRYSLCPLCGQPAHERIHCKQCGRSESVCSSCAPKETCSKNCAHHSAIGSNSRKVHLPELKKRKRDF